VSLGGGVLGRAFQVLIISRILYDISARGAFLHTDGKHEIDAFFVRACHLGLSIPYYLLLVKLFSASYAIAVCSPSVKNMHCALRDSDHEIILPEFSVSLNE
jgi:hypothetical protein